MAASSTTTGWRKTLPEHRELPHPSHRGAHHTAPQTAGWSYIERIEIRDVEQYQRDMASPAGQELIRQLYENYWTGSKNDLLLVPKRSRTEEEAAMGSTGQPVGILLVTAGAAAARLRRAVQRAPRRRTSGRWSWRGTPTSTPSTPRCSSRAAATSRWPTSTTRPIMLEGAARRGQAGPVPLRARRVGPHARRVLGDGARRRHDRVQDPHGHEVPERPAGHRRTPSSTRSTAACSVARLHAPDLPDADPGDRAGAVRWCATTTRSPST